MTRLGYLGFIVGPSTIGFFVADDDVAGGFVGCGGVLCGVGVVGAGDGRGEAGCSKNAVELKHATLYH